ncbi:MAG: LytTR family DNA-binding domain-containing protein [Eubacterium sp.]|nr:LytTR family DNA-binding domain-containing protein [Eubacterium sp.]
MVEDEEMYVQQLTGYLKEYQKTYGEEIDITVYRDGDGITAKYKAQFDIILMDIQMRFMDGMSAAEEIRKQDSEVVIMFITNMTQYAIRGYEVDALDYILKPVSYFAFSQKLGRAIGRIKKRDNRQITVSVKGGIIRLDVSDIYYIESVGHNLIYHSAKGNHMASGTMKSVEEEMEELNFSRGNKCYLINLEHVEGIRDKCAIVKGEALQISRPRMKGFMQDLTKYWGDLK